MADAEPLMDRAQMRALLARARQQPVNAAIGLGPTGEALLLLDRVKPPRGVEKQLLAQVPQAKGTRWGVASVDPERDPKLLRLQLNRPVAGFARRLKTALRGTGVTRIEIVLEDGSAVEADLEDEEAGPVAPASPAAALAALRAEFLALGARLQGAGWTPEQAGLAQQAGVALKAGDMTAAAAAVARLRALLPEASAASAAPAAPPSAAPPSAASSSAALPSAASPSAASIGPAPASTAAPRPPLARLARVALGPAPPPPPPDLAAMLLAARAEAETQAEALRRRLGASPDPTLQRIAAAIPAALPAHLGAGLAQVLASAPADQAAAAVQAMRAQLQADPLLGLVEANPEGVAVSIRATMATALDAIERGLAHGSLGRKA